MSMNITFYLEMKALLIHFFPNNLKVKINPRKHSSIVKAIQILSNPSLK